MKNKFDVKIVTLWFFQAVYVIPIINNWIFSYPNFRYKYPIYQAAIEDPLTDNIYNAFVIIVPMIMSFSIKNYNNKNKSRLDLRETVSKMKIPRKVFVFSVFLMFLPLILVLFSPAPEKYMLNYAYFQRFRSLATESELWYHVNVMRAAQIVSLVSILIVRSFGKKDITNSILIYLAAISAGILNGKRTLFAMILLGILSVDILKSPKGKFPYKKAIITFVFLLFFFVGYANLIDKHTKNFTQLDDLRLYFFRDFDVKMSIYAFLYPDKQTILDYKGQSYLYNLTFLIPRTLWPDKPYPYAYYATSASLGYANPVLLTWTVQTSYFGELIANFGLKGIIIGIVIMNVFINVSQKTGKPMIILLAMFIVMFSFMNHFLAFAYYLLIWLILMIHHNFYSKSSERGVLKY